MENRICLELGKRTRSSGSVIRKNGSKKLYVSLRYFGKRIEKSSGLPDTAKNRKQLDQWVKHVLEKIEDGTFRFADAFPGASDEEKAFFAHREGWDYVPDPHTIFIGEYIKHWKETICSTYRSEGKKRDYLQTIDTWIIPYFGQKTFFQLNRVEIQKFLSLLKWRKGEKEGQPLSRSRMRNIIIPLRAIWFDACDEYRWDLSDPFRNIGKYLPRSSTVRREVFRFDDWLKLLEHFDPYFRPVAEIMVMTGMIASEIAGLRRTDIEDGYLLIRNSMVRGHEKSDLKTSYRERKLFITAALQQRLDELLERSDGPYLVTTKTGLPFRDGTFRNNYWRKALENAGLEYKVPYTTRHSFAAWSLTMGMDPNRLVRLMGHVSKKMIYDVYGDYVEGLEEDQEKLLDYFGTDFLSTNNKRHNSVLAKKWRKSRENQPLRLVSS